MKYIQTSEQCQQVVVKTSSLVKHVLFLHLVVCNCSLELLVNFVIHNMQSMLNVMVTMLLWISMLHVVSFCNLYMLYFKCYGNICMKRFMQSRNALKLIVYFLNAFKCFFSDFSLPDGIQNFLVPSNSLWNT